MARFLLVATLADNADATSRCSADCSSTSTWDSRAACVAVAVSSCFSAALAFFSCMSAWALFPCAINSAALALAKLALSLNDSTWAWTD